MQIKLGRNLSLAGMRRPFTKANDLDLGAGRVHVSGNNFAGYCTSIPISELSYRRDNATHAHAKYELNNGWHEFTIWDDWGTCHEVSISDDAEGRDLARKQVESLIENGLLPRPDETSASVYGEKE